MSAKKVTINVRPATWAMVERMAEHAAGKTGRAITPEESATTLIEVGLRALAQDLRDSAEPEQVALARTLVGI